MDLKRTDATRYLCAAAHLNRGFRNRVVQQLIEQEHKAVGSAYGVDLGTVLAHCLAAKRRTKQRDLQLAVLVITFSLFSYLSWRGNQTVFNLGLILGYAQLTWLVAWPFVFAEMWIGRYRLAVGSFSRERYDPNRHEPTLSAQETKKLQEISDAQNGNLMVYSGFSPFVGSGFDIGGWSFAVNMQKGVDRNGRLLQPVPFELGELYDYIQNELKKLGLEGLSIDEKVFVSGHEVRDDERFLSHPFARPRSTIDKALIAEIRESPTQAVRHYQCIRLVQCNGDLILSIYLRFWRAGQSLFTEASYFVLPPIDKKYRKVDEYAPRPSWLITWLRQALIFPLSYIVTPFVLARSLIVLLYEIVYPIGKWLDRLLQKLIIREVPMYDYGVATSIREEVSSPSYDQFFQKLDNEMYLKIVERQMLDGLVDFLSDHNVDTSELKEREASILNQGLIMYGGTLKAGTLAVGKKASARSTTKISRPTILPAEASTARPRGKRRRQN